MSEPVYMLGHTARLTLTSGNREYDITEAIVAGAGGWTIAVEKVLDLLERAEQSRVETQLARLTAAANEVMRRLPERDDVQRILRDALPGDEVGRGVDANPDEGGQEQ